MLTDGAFKYLYGVVVDEGVWNGVLQYRVSIAGLLSWIPADFVEVLPQQKKP